MIAGRDTTACLLTWSLIEFCKNPEWEKKCLDEINDIFDNNDNNDNYNNFPSYDKVQNLKNLHMFLSEVLRLHPPLPTDMKRALKDDVWPDGSRIPAGTYCSYLPYAAGRCSKNWGDDCLEFNPERWDDLQF